MTRIVLVFCALLTAFAAFADPALVVRNVTVIDGTGAAPAAGRTVVISNGVIQQIDAANQITLPQNATILDGTGKYLIPGLWDMHVHTALIANPAWIRSVCMPLFTSNGITGIRDMGGDFDLIRQVRKEIEEGKITGPRIIAAGPMLDGPGEAFPPVIRLESEAAARAAVDSLREMKVDFVKILSSLPRPVYFAVADESKKLGIPFVGHIPVDIRAAEASDAGQKSIEHLDGVLLSCSSQEEQLRKEIDEALAKSDFQAFAGLRSRMLASFDGPKASALFQKFVKNGTWQCPTFGFLRSQSSLEEARKKAGTAVEHVPEEILNQWNEAIQKSQRSEADLEVGKRRYSKNLEIVGAMKKSGVAILAGTDTDGETPFLVPGFSLHDELQTLVEAGLTPMEALQSATLQPAQFLGLEKTLGTLEKGKQADAVLLDANPLLDISNTRRISAIILRGKLVPRTK